MKKQIGADKEINEYTGITIKILKIIGTASHIKKKLIKLVKWKMKKILKKIAKNGKKLILENKILGTGE